MEEIKKDIEKSEWSGLTLFVGKELYQWMGDNLLLKPKKIAGWRGIELAGGIFVVFVLSFKAWELDYYIKNGTIK